MDLKENWELKIVNLKLRVVNCQLRTLILGALCAWDFISFINEGVRFEVRSPIIRNFYASWESVRNWQLYVRNFMHHGDSFAIIVILHRENHFPFLARYNHSFCLLVDIV